MATSEAQKRAVVKYDTKHYDRLTIRLPKGTSEIIKANGYTVNGLINELVKKQLEEWSK